MWTMPDSLITQIMKHKYFLECSILEATVEKKPFYAWGIIQRACSVLTEGLVWRIGNGEKVKIWEDKWLPNSSTGKVLSTSRYLAPNATVSELFDESGCGWNTSLLAELFTVDEGKQIRSIPISLTKQEDRLIWRGTSKGVFFL